MKYHKQNIEHKPEDGQYGNCHQTAIACLLDKELDEVPHFGEHFEDSKLFYGLQDSYLASQGLATFTMAFNGSDGLELVLSSIGCMNKNVQYLIAGRSSRGINHTVIGKGAKIVHDPHPSGEGICSPCDDGYFWVTVLIPLSQVDGYEQPLQRTAKMTYEQDRARMEAERNAAEDEYFAARPHISLAGHRLLTDGYERGWNERNKKVMELQAQIDALRTEYTQYKLDARWEALE